MALVARTSSNPSIGASSSSCSSLLGNMCKRQRPTECVHSLPVTEVVRHVTEFAEGRADVSLFGRYVAQVPVGVWRKAVKASQFVRVLERLAVFPHDITAGHTARDITAGHSARLEAFTAVAEKSEQSAHVPASSADLNALVHGALERSNPRALELLLRVARAQGTALFLAAVVDTARMGISPLCKAVAKRHEKCVQLLCAAGAVADAQDRVGKWLLLNAIQKGNDAILHELIGAGASVSAVDGEGEGALHYSVAYGTAETTKRLLCAGAPSHVPNVYNKTPLDCAFELQAVDHIPWLLKHEEDKGQTREELAAKMLTRMCGSLTTSLSGEGLVGLLRTMHCEASVPEIVALSGTLAECGGETCLHVAARKNSAEWVALLLSCGVEADISAGAADISGAGADISGAGATPLLLATSCGSWAAALALLEGGASAEACDEAARAEGDTLYHRAARDNAHSFVRVLGARGIACRVNAAGEAPHVGTTASMRALLPTAVLGTCSVCDEECEMLPIAACSHCFCMGCLGQWVKAGDGVQSVFSCPHAQCSAKLTNAEVLAALKSDPAAHARMDDLLATMEMRRMGDFTFCPNEACTAGGFSTLCEHAECWECGQDMCGLCGLVHEDREQCLVRRDLQLVDAWMREESTTRKQCPSCSVRIQHDGGCTHVRCRACQYEMCWACLGPYKGNYSFDIRICPCGK